MEDPNTDSFDPTAADYLLRASTSSPDSDFGFAFNDIKFSDRVLRIEIVGQSNETDPGFGESNVTENVVDVSIRLQQQGLTSDEPNNVVVLPIENPDEGPVATVEESGDETANRNDSSTVVRVKTLHISSPILAAKSPFFYKLFSNGMKESDERCVTLRIDASEEAALMELLNFMYSNSLSVTTAPALLDVLMTADKYEVSSCIRYCSRQLQPLLTTTESALLFLELPPSVLMAEEVQSVTDTAKQYLATRYSDMVKYQDEVLALPLSGMEAILCSNHLQIPSEDAVFDLVLKWARKHHPVLEERREVLGTHLAKFIRFPYMSCRKLQRLLWIYTDFDRETASKVVLEALFFKAEVPHKQRALIEESSSSSRRFIERTYKYRPVKIVELEYPRKECVVYLDLKREECTRLFPSGRIYSQAFHLGGQGFFLFGHCNIDQQSSLHSFGLFLGMQEIGPVPITVDYEFSARSKPSEKFVIKYADNYTFSRGKAVGYRNLLGIPWVLFVGEDSIYFINDTLHLRAELTIRP